MAVFYLLEDEEGEVCVATQNLSYALEVLNSISIIPKPEKASLMRLAIPIDSQSIISLLGNRGGYATDIKRYRYYSKTWEK
jgi:hypothetical protein